MANLSQIKRERMLKFLEKLKDQHTDDESLIALNEIEKELTSKKYGLVWEEHEEEVDKMMETHIPVFTEDKDREIIGNPDSEDCNFLLDGDNLHSLKLLEKTHKGKIDVIYIDPPYNTGKEFVYNDDIISQLDGYSHSKWLSFMSKRLTIAKQLLSDKGVIFLSIDDNEHSQLKLLCDSIFCEDNMVADFCVIRAEGGGMAKQVIKGHDYALVYAKNIDKFRPLAKKKDVRGKIIEKDGVEYWIQEDWLRKEFGKYGNCHYEELAKYKDKKTIDEIEKGLKSGRYILIPKDNGMNIVGKLRRLDEDSSKFYSIIKHLNKDGVKGLKELNLSQSFDYPKPVSLIKELVSGATFFSKKEHNIVLDFFAGSGTTAQAVLELNQEDGGNRKFILCTNNENDICEKITYERIKTVITGKKQDGTEYSEGIPANLKYYKTDFIRKDNEDEELSEELLEHIIEMIELEYGISIDNKKHVIIMDDDEMDDFEGNFSDYPDLKAVFLNQEVLLSTSQEKLLENVNTYIIPDYYFGEELREAGELW